MVSLHQLLESCLYHDGSCLHLKAGCPPMVRIDRDLLPMEMEPLAANEVRELCYSTLTGAQKAQFEQDLELDFEYDVPGMARFGANLFLQRGAVGGVFRVIAYNVCFALGNVEGI
jgi:twitching motility protein PilT